MRRASEVSIRSRRAVRLELLGHPFGTESAVKPINSEHRDPVDPSYPQSLPRLRWVRNLVGLYNKNSTKSSRMFRSPNEDR